MRIDMVEVRKREELGLVSVRQHPRLPILILNYTHKCQYDRAWDDITTVCRGLIVDMEGNVIANTFPKFYNVNEKEETKTENLPAEVPEITNKLDGSLGTLHFEGDEPFIASRGAFESEQAQWATKWIQATGLKRKDFLAGFTYLFEIIYPKNRIVVDYGDKAELVLLAVRNTLDGHEPLDHIMLTAESKRLKLPCVGNVKANSIEELKSKLIGMNGNKEEGFVVRYSNGLRVKMKCDDYLRMHKLITQASNVALWELLRDKKPIDELLQKVPDEFMGWVRKWADKLNGEAAIIFVKAKSIADEAIKLPTRKEQALYIMEKAPDIRGTVFELMDNNLDRVHNSIWKRIRPTFEVFKVDDTG